MDGANRTVRLDIQALRAAGVRAEILVFGALSVSDLDGLFEYRLTPTVSSPGAAIMTGRPGARRP